MSPRRIAVVTASKGIGFETAKKLAAAAGLTTIICGRDEEHGKAAAKEACTVGDVLFRKLDISNPDSINAFV